MVEIEAVINADGSVGAARISKSLDAEHGLDQQAMLAMGKSTFEPATLNGQAVAALVTMHFNFRLH
jgi:TonB family protein